MRILVTGSSGQIGTNLALRLLEDGHWVFGVDKRPSPGRAISRRSCRTWPGHYPPYRGGMNGVEWPEVDLVVHLAAHAKVHQLVRQPQRALENVMMTFNMLEYCRALELPLVFSSTREVYGDVHRFDGYGEATADFAYTESPYSASKIGSEAFIYAYAKCYGLGYLVFRFSNVYGRYDNDLAADGARVAALHAPARGASEPITVYGGEAKVLDFTYIDDCVDGIVRGIERPRRWRGPERDDQPRLRPGEHARPRGRADRRRAGRLARDRLQAFASRRGHPLRRRHPQGARAARLAARRRRSTPGSRSRSSGSANGALSTRKRITRSSPSASPARSSTPSSLTPRVVALFGPTASGKTAVAGLLRERLDGEVVSADSAALYAGIPILTAAPDYPARLVGVVPLDQDVSVGEFQRLAHAAIDEILAAGRTAIVAGGTGLYLRAALSATRAPAATAPGARERWSAFYDEQGAEAAHEEFARRDPAAAERVHPNDKPARRACARARRVRLLARAARGHALGSRHPPADAPRRGSTLPRRPRRTHRGASRPHDRGGSGGRGEGGMGADRCRSTARAVLGLEELATMPVEDARSDSRCGHPPSGALSAKNGPRRLTVAATLDGDRPPGEIADEIVALAGAGERLPRS